MSQKSKELSTILVVDDEEVVRFTLQKKLSRLGYNVISLEKAEDVLYIIKNNVEKVDLIITDVKLRKMDGIELLRRVKNSDEPIPVLLVTGHGNVEDAIRALKYGANDYIRKPFDINEVAISVRNILRRKEEEKIADNFGTYSVFEKSIFEIYNEPQLINPLSYKLTRDLVPLGLFNETTCENITLALREAISNAMFHGNLEISSEIRNNGGIKQFNLEIEKRKSLEPYVLRKIKIIYEKTLDFVEYVIEDCGNGFDCNNLPDPRDPDNFFKNNGRGLLIIRIHMDEVEWNDKGNLIRMRKYKVERKDIEKGEQDVYS